MNTRARIATICQSGNFHPTVMENNAEILNRLTLALKQNPDLVCLPESFSSGSVPRETVANLVETIPGPTTDLVAKAARENRCYILCPVFTKREGRYWNTVVVIDRTGNIIGFYDKSSPTLPTNNTGRA